MFGGNHIDWNLTSRAKLSTGLSEQDAQRIEHLGTRPQSVSGTVGPELLANRDGGRQTGNAISRRAFDAIQELAGRRREGLDISSLALRIQSIERQAAFSGTAEPADYCQSVVSNLQGDALQVVNSPTFQFNKPGNGHQTDPLNEELLQGRDAIIRPAAVSAST